LPFLPSVGQSQVFATVTQAVYPEPKPYALDGELGLIPRLMALYMFCCSSCGRIKARQVRQLS